MMISTEHFKEFKLLMRKHYGEDKVNNMTEDELYEQAIKLVRFIKIVESNNN